MLLIYARVLDRSMASKMGVFGAFHESLSYWSQGLRTGNMAGLRYCFYIFQWHYGVVSEIIDKKIYLQTFLASCFSLYFRVPRLPVLIRFYLLNLPGAIKWLRWNSKYAVQLQNWYHVCEPQTKKRKPNNTKQVLQHSM